MRRPLWTVMLVPHDNERVRSYQISGSEVKLALGVSIFVGILLAVLSTGAVMKHGGDLRAMRVARENRVLEAEVETMRTQVASLSRSIDSLSQAGRKYRVLAGLDEIDRDVERVGIGGPGTATLRSSVLFRLNEQSGRKVFETSSNLETLLRRANLLRSNLDEATKSLATNTARLAATPSIAPSMGHLSSLFSNGRYHPVLKITRPHKGIDIAAPIGQPILAPAQGRVRFAGFKSGGYGKVVEIDHGFGYVTRFAHSSALHVKAGEQVKRGQVIAAVGATGIVSGPHLHYEVEVNGRAVDPLHFIISDAIPD